MRALSLSLSHTSTRAHTHMHMHTHTHKHQHKKNSSVKFFSKHIKIFSQICKSFFKYVRLFWQIWNTGSPQTAELPSYAHTRTHIHTHAHLHTCTNMCAHTHIHSAYMHVHKHTHTRTHTHSLTHKRTHMMMMLAFITFKSSLVPLFEGLWSSISWEFELSGFSRNRTDDLGIDSPSLWPTEPRLHVRSNTYMHTDTTCVYIFTYMYT